MTLKEELEILRGEPIEVYTGDPMGIPCVETSNQERLCKNPVVSVDMITYNHEPYIRQAIEGVMMQQTDFEFELVIGEDCSQDKTREICFEYQKKYPDKIRVLWWHENVSKLGGNGRRTCAHCRGEFLAMCEGDDYWTDPLKLQKQVNLLRRNPNAGLCFGAVEFYYEATGRRHRPTKGELRSGVMSGRKFCEWLLLEQNPKGRNVLQTSGNMFRMSVVREARAKFEVFNWYAYDLTGWLGYAAISDVCFLPDIVSTYRITGGGVTKRSFVKVITEGDCVAYYFVRAALGFTPEEALRWTAKRFVRMWVNKAAALPCGEQRKIVERINGHPLLRQIFHRPYGIFMLMAIRFGWLTPQIAFWLNRVYWYVPRLGRPWKVKPVP